MRIVKIGAVWCMTCLSLSKKLYKVRDEMGVSLLELEYDMDKEEVDKFNVGDDIPVTIFMDKNNLEIERFNGDIKMDKLIEKVNLYRDR